MRKRKVPPDDPDRGDDLPDATRLERVREGMKGERSLRVLELLVVDLARCGVDLRGCEALVGGRMVKVG
jgi:hypothetical protein